MTNIPTDEKPFFQVGDFIEIEIPIVHSANITAARAHFAWDGHDYRDIPAWWNEEASLHEMQEEDGRMVTQAVFKLEVSRRITPGDYIMRSLQVDYASGRENVQVEDAPPIKFRVVDEQSDFLRARGFSIDKP